MDVNNLIETGNQLRADRQPELALKCYAQALIEDPHSSAAFNNYGNVLRECGYPDRAIPFLQNAIAIEPRNITAYFNLAVSYLLLGNYQQGFPAYEARWQYEHLAGTEPKFSQPKWKGESLSGKTILVVGEQGHGDNIQFVRFLYNLHAAGAVVKFQTTDGLISLFSRSNVISWVGSYEADPGEFDYWIPLMSITNILGITLETLPKVQSYINARHDLQQQWLAKLGPKKRMRVGISWSGRKDSWLNQHKSVPFELILKMINANSQYEWINLQVDVSEQESQQLTAAGVTQYPGSIFSFDDTAALMHHLDVVISVDTAVSHLAGALGRPTWVMLNQYATDWRWLLKRDDSPWYSSVRLFRQPARDDWDSVTKKVTQYLSWFKV